MNPTTDKEGNEIYWIHCITCGREYHKRVKDDGWPKQKYVTMDGEVIYGPHRDMRHYTWYKECEECENESNNKSKSINRGLDFGYKNKEMGFPTNPNVSPYKKKGFRIDWSDFSEYKYRPKNTDEVKK